MSNSEQPDLVIEAYGTVTPPPDQPDDDGDAADTPDESDES